MKSAPWAPMMAPPLPYEDPVVDFARNVLGVRLEPWQRDTITAMAVDAQYAATYARLAATDPEYIRLKAAADEEARVSLRGTPFARNQLALYVESQMPLFPVRRGR